MPRGLAAYEERLCEVRCEESVREEGEYGRKRRRMISLSLKGHVKGVVIQGV